MIRVAYLVNQYPKVSHSFIRREILALERRGVEVLRIALRGWDAEVADAEDAQERERTRYVLQDGVVPLLPRRSGRWSRAPVRFARALGLVMRMARRSRRPLPYHLAYLAEACRLLPWLREYGATHVHAHFGTNAAEVAMLTAPRRARIQLHGARAGGVRRARGARARREDAACPVRRGDQLLWARQLMRWSAHADWPKIHVVHCGVDAAFYSVPAAPLPEAPRCVCVGRLCEQKGQLLLVEAVARLAARGVACELVLAGDGEMRRDVEAAIARHHLESSVRITGWIDGEQVRKEILDARLLVLPSFAEGLPVVIMEALALRRPVITTYVAGIPELVRHGENGWLVPAGDVAALAGALEEAISESPLTLARMGEAGRARVLERHAIDTEVAKLAEHFLAAAGPDAASRALRGATA